MCFKELNLNHLLSEIVQSAAMKLISNGKNFDQLISKFDEMRLDQLNQCIQDSAAGKSDNHILMIYYIRLNSYFYYQLIL